MSSEQNAMNEGASILHRANGMRFQMEAKVPIYLLKLI